MVVVEPVFQVRLSLTPNGDPDVDHIRAGAEVDLGVHGPVAMVDIAEGYREKKINSARGEAEAYLEKLSAYQEARWITDIRLYLETMEKILPGVKKVFVDRNIKKETTDLWLVDEKTRGRVVGFE